MDKLEKTSFIGKMKAFYGGNKAIILLMLFTFALFVISFVPFTLFVPVKKIFDEPEIIKNWLTQYGNWAILGYVALSIITIIIPAVPNEVVTLVGGMAFPFWQALVFGLIARVIGSSVNYALGRGIRRGVFNRFINDEERAKLKGYTKKIGWQTAFLARFLPSTDTDLIAYMAGMAHMHYPTFILASFLGMFVPVSVTILIGSTMLGNKTLFFILIAFYVIGMLCAPLLFKKFRKKTGLTEAEKIIE